MNKERTGFGPNGRLPDIELNARTVKFFLDLNPESEHDRMTKETKRTTLSEVLQILDPAILVGLYSAATSADGYCRDPKFAEGFEMLERELLARGLVTIEEVNRQRSRTAVHNITIDASGTFRDMVTGRDAEEIIRRYSMMKFGSQKEIKDFGKEIAERYIARLRDPDDDLINFYRSVKENGEFVAIVAPGYRNVESASNVVTRVATELINVELATLDLSTIVIKRLTRLASNQANYAALSKEERAALPLVADHILPGAEFFQFPIHLIFADDVRITGATEEGVERSSQKNGARSFSSMYAIQVDPVVATAQPEIEDRLNRFQVKGRLDNDIAYILNQEGFQPVQRLLRLVLNEKNREDLREFLYYRVNDQALNRLYVAAMGNDYRKDPRYRESVEILGEVIREKKV